MIEEKEENTRLSSIPYLQSEDLRSFEVKLEKAYKSFG